MRCFGRGVFTRISNFRRLILTLLCGLGYFRSFFIILCRDRFGGTLRCGLALLLRLFRGYRIIPRIVIAECILRIGFLFSPDRHQ